MTAQARLDYETLDEVLKPKGVAVIIEASHGCMSTRGVNQHGVSMVTKCWLDEFRSDADLRSELMDSVRAGCGRPLAVPGSA